MKKIIYLIIVVVFMYFFYEMKIKKEKEIIQEIKKENILLKINEETFIVDENLKIINTSIKNDKFLTLTFVDPNNEITSCYFDDNKLELINYENNTKTYKSTYEINPSKAKLQIFNKDIKKEIDFNIKYELLNNYNSFFEQWDTKNKYEINDYIKFKENEKVSLSYNKTFNYDKNLNFKISFLTEDIKNTDLKLVYGDSFFVSFNNNSIKTNIKGKDNKINKYLVSNKNKIKNNMKINIDLNVVYLDLLKYKYIVKINDEQYEFIDENKNNVEFERYKEFKILINNMPIKIENIEIKEN